VHVEEQQQPRDRMWAAEMTDMETRYKNLLSTEIAGVKASYKKESKEERKEAEQEKFNDIPKMFLQNGMVQRMVERVLEIEDAEDAEREERDIVQD
jgi:hypothetical protein